MQFIRCSLVICLVAVIACGDNSQSGTDAPSGPQCSDHVDNDGDGTIDFPDDLGCEDANSNTESSPIKSACQDNRDNDGDGKVDFPNDPGCPAPQADDESDPCPNGAGCPQCGDGKDNDGNGMADFPDDPGCSSAYDSVEFTDNPTACGQGMVIKMLPQTNTDSGALVGTTSMVSSPCGGGNGLPAVAYVFHISTPKVIVATTDDSQTQIDSVLDLRTAMCTDPASEIACNDDIVATGTGANHKSSLTASLNAGTYYLIVGGKTAADTGAYVLNVHFLSGEGASCTTIDDCGPGLVCRIPVGQTTMVCTGPVCHDNRDDDGDGKIDYPNDPGCASPTDDTENDVCNTNPLDPQCPECSNTLDDNGDGDTDYPADVHCHSASATSESCVQSDDVGVIDQPAVMGTTVGAVNDYKPSCGSSSHNAPDVAYRLELPPMATLKLEVVASFDAAHALLTSTCENPAVACSDPQIMNRTNVAAGTYYVVVDGWSTASGTFTINTSGTVAAGGSCEGLLFQAGAFTCAPGYSCAGALGSRTCTAVACNDGVDNDGDGKSDVADPGCTSAADTDESGDDCSPTVGPNCPQCSDGVDNDADGTTDYPTDTSCVRASANSESCLASEAIVALTMPQTMGDTSTAVNDYRPVAGSVNGHLCSTTSTTTATAPDLTYSLDVPAMDTLSVHLNSPSYDSSHTLLNSTCGGTPIDCSDSPTGMNLTNITAGRYYLVVDGYSSGSGTYTIDVSGTIKLGESCESALAQSGAIVCKAGTTCAGVPGARICMPDACQDGVDNDGDGKIDVADPGCVAGADNDESDDCSPTVGPNCPECSDLIDNDGDGATDYPTDTSCNRASARTEACVATEGVTVLTMGQTMGTTVGATNDYRPVAGSVNGHLCSTTSTTTATAPDLTYELDVPAMSTLNVHLNSPSYDSSHTLLNSTCGGTPIDCSDAPGGMNLTNIAAGRYYLVVDGYSSGSGTYTIDVSGTIKPGESCESPLAQAGALVCPTSFTCTGPVGMRRCIGNFACSDAVDNDGDGKLDYPFDPGCTSATDTDEMDDCYPVVGPNCPQCGNGIDDDLDLLSDFPADPQCPDASFFREAYCTLEAPADLVGDITMPTTMGNLMNATDNYEQSCQSNTGKDQTYTLSLPVPVARLRVDTVGSPGDTVLSLWNSLCTSEIECDDDGGGSLDSLIVRTNVPAGNYAIQVDMYNQTTNPTAFTLNVQGTVAPGTACTDPLFTSGVLVCPTGTTCSAGICQ